MSPAVLRRYLLPLAFGIGTLAAYGADQRLSTDGLEVYYGIVPTAIVREQPGQHDLSAHGGGGRRNARYLLVALFDIESGHRIEDAAVLASVTPLGLASEKKSLAPMRINNTITYGNFFDFPVGSGPFSIVLTVERPHRPSVTAAFQYSE